MEILAAYFVNLVMLEVEISAAIVFEEFLEASLGFLFRTNARLFRKSCLTFRLRVIFLVTCCEFLALLCSARARARF